MKILHITLGLGNGGAEGALYRLVSHDINNNHFIISVMGDGIYGNELRNRGVEVYSYDVLRGDVPLNTFWKLYRDIRRIKPDVIQTWLYHADIMGGVIGRLAGVNRIFWGIRHSNLSPALNSRLTILMSKVSALLSGFIPERIISCSSKATNIHIDVGYRREKFITIPNGYDFATLNFSVDKRFQSRKMLNLDESFVFGMVGRWNLQKNHKNLIQALSIFVEKFNINVKLLMVGPGVDEKNRELCLMIDKCKLSTYVHLLGPTNDISNIMSTIDVLVLPSLGEAFPNVVAESMACGTPVVSTDVGDASYIVGDCGWIVPSDDSNALAIGMFEAYKMSRNVEKWDLLKQQCRQRIQEHFSIQKMVENFNRAWKG